MENKLKYVRINRNLSIFWSLMWCLAIALNINQIMTDGSNPLTKILVIPLLILLLFCIVKWSKCSKTIHRIKREIKKQEQNLYE